MPEAAEIRTVADQLRPYLVTRSISNCHVGTRAKITGIHKLSYPATIINVRSYGKKVIIDLNNDHLIIASFGMTGRLQYTPGNHSHIRFDISDVEMKGPLKVLTNTFHLYFDDYRYMGNINIIHVNEWNIYCGELGPDLLQHALSETTWIPSNKWIEIFTAKKWKNRQISGLLMEQSTVAGIGNYLSSEILYYSGVHPERIVSTITLAEWDLIRVNSHKVVLLAYSYGGFTIKDYISPDGSHGGYPAAVYGKTHDALGNLVVRKKMKGGRTAHFVPTLQY